MKPIRMLATAAGIVCFATSAMAASLTVTDIQAQWSSSRPTVSGLGTDQIRWGRPAETKQSGYNFTSSDVPFSVQDQNEFVIGTFSHENFPVFGSFLRSANLTVQFSVVGVSQPITSTFSFTHLETLNTPSGPLCQNGEANGVGVNASGCADRVTATLNPDKSETFVIDGVTYELDIFGFRRDGVKFTEFWTEENKSNEAKLIAIFNVLDVEEPNVVPLPAAGWLLLFGLASLGLLRRKG